MESIGGNVTFDILTSFASSASLISFASRASMASFTIFASFADFALFAFFSWTSFITIPTMFGDWVIYCLHFLAPYVPLAYLNT